ncbi:hypothetical protein GBAR_LOCUS18030, partial [Geodia barretti]
MNNSMMVGTQTSSSSEKIRRTPTVRWNFSGVQYRRFEQRDSVSDVGHSERDADEVCGFLLLSVGPFIPLTPTLYTPIHNHFYPNYHIPLTPTLSTPLSTPIHNHYFYPNYHIPLTPITTFLFPQLQTFYPYSTLPQHYLSQLPHSSYPNYKHYFYPNYHIPPITSFPLPQHYLTPISIPLTLQLFLPQLPHSPYPN